MDEPAPTPAVNCPHCGSAIEQKLTDQPQIVVCPACNQAFVLPAADGTTLAVAQISEPPPAGGEGEFVVRDDYVRDNRPDDLDGLRIRQIAAAQRSAYRSRSYFLMGGLVCLAGAGQFVWKAVEHIRAGDWGIGTLAYLCAVPMCVFLALRFYYRSEKFREEAEQTKLPALDHAPDFTGLSDGSHQWKNLE